MAICLALVLIDRQTNNIPSKVGILDHKADILDLRQDTMAHRVAISNLLLSMAKHRVTTRATKAIPGELLADPLLLVNIRQVPQWVVKDHLPLSTQPEEINQAGAERPITITHRVAQQHHNLPDRMMARVV